MSKKLLAIYEEALERIRDMNPITPEVTKIATEALMLGEKDTEAEKAALLVTLRDFIIANGMIFDAAEEMVEKLNSDGSITTLRGKPWTRASIARLMPEIRVSIVAATSKTSAKTTAPTVETVQVEPVEVEVEVEVEDPTPTPTPAPEVQEVSIIDDLAELDELEGLEELLADV